MTKIRQFICAALIPFAVLCSLPAADAAITFTPGHIYSTYTDSGIIGDTGYRNIIEYDASGAVVGRVVIPSLAQRDEIKGIVFGPDGLLYAVKINGPNYGGLAVLVLDSSGAVHDTYTYNGVSSADVFDGKIAVDQQYIYVAVGSNLVRFTIGDPNSGVSIYSSPEFSVLDVKILPNGHLFVASDYQVDEITNDGTLVRTVVSNHGIDFVDITGIEYDPVTNKLFVAELGVLGAAYTLVRVNASTGAIEAGAFFDNAADLFLTESGTLLVGCWTDTPRIYNENWAFRRWIGTDQRLFVTQMRSPALPVITTNAILIASFSATLNGSVNPNGHSTNVYFEYGPTTAYGFTTPVHTQNGNISTSVSADISGLSASTTYHFRIVAVNGAGTHYGVDRTFTTLSATGPAVVTNKPTTLIASYSATLNGSLNPHGLSTSVYFEYGTTSDYGSTTPTQTQNGSTYRSISANISGLSASTWYHFRMVASNSAGTTYGIDQVFFTLDQDGLPIVATYPATNIASFSATVNGLIDPRGSAIAVHFEWGTTTSYGHTTPMLTQAGDTYRNVSANISGLSASTIYHFRMVATNGGNIIYGAGADNTFTTLSATGKPVVTTNPATLTASYSAALNGSLDPHGLTTSVYFQYGSTTSYGSTTPVQTQNGSTFRNISATIAGLSASTAYHFRVVAHNNSGTTYGADRTFTTRSATGPPIVSSNAATLLASFSGTLNGSLDPHGLTTSVYFEYGTTSDYGLSTAPQSQSGNPYRNINANISGLSVSTTYHFRIVASNSAGTTYSSDRTFTTLSATGRPAAITDPATNVTSSLATLKAVVDPHGLTTSVYFQYGATTSYGLTTPMQSQAGNIFRDVSGNISGLNAGTAYHFRIVATNSAGITYGQDRVFSTF
jgi:hypothetical protein